ncbi:MAG: DUF541 domain-containing protein [Dehalococcoidia bacterium]|nr:DUF541 domain-containing protein [Dehalococcoidia bacterium]
MTPSLTRRHAIRTIFGGAVAAAALAALACTPTTQVTVASPAQQSGIAVIGTASVSVKPDVARLNLGVEVTDASVATARARAADTMTKVQAALKQKGVQEKDIRTQYLNISPQYTSSPDRTAPPTIRGYVVNNQLQITVRNIDSASEVLDAAVAAGGNAVRVNGISFAVDQPEQFLAQAREEAVRNARARAEVLAKAAGVSLGTARSITESTNGGPIPFPERAAAAPSSLGGPTPVNPGEQSLQLTVSVVYDISAGK